MLRVSLMAVLSVLVAGAAMAELPVPATVVEAVNPVEASGGNPFLARNQMMMLDNVCDILGTIASPAYQTNGMTFDGTYLWVVSNATVPSTLYQVDPATGGVVFSCTAPWPSYTLGLTYDPVNNTIWGADFVNNLVTQMDMNCNYVSSFYTSGLGLTGIRGLAYDPMEDALVIGDVYAMACVWVTRAGALTGRTCSTAAHIMWHMGMEFGPSGFLWCTDNSTANDISKLDVSGPNSVELVVCGTPEPSNIPEGLTLDADAQLRHITHYGSSIWQIESDEGPGIDTAYVQVLDVWTDAATYEPGDVVTLTLEWKFVYSGMGSPGWSDPEDLRVAGGLAKEPNLNPRQVDATVLAGVSPGTYTTNFTFTVPMAAPYGIWVAGGGGVVPTWSGFGQPQASKLIERNMFEIALPPAGEWLFWDDGTYENGLSATGPGYTSATGLNPMTVPCVVESIKCFISSYNNWNNPGDMYILDDLGGYPNNILGGPYTVQATSPDTWVQVAVNVPVTQPRFYVGLECTEAIAYGPYVGADTDVPCNIDHQYWGTVSPPSWTLLYTFGSPFDCFDISYRAWVNYADGRGEWLSPATD